MTTEVPRNWLLSIVSVEEIDAWQAALPKPGLQQLDPVQTEWQMLKAKMLPGDEIWYFSSDPESWRHLAGREGYALVRDGDVIDAITTGMT